MTRTIVHLFRSNKGGVEDDSALFYGNGCGVECWLLGFLKDNPSYEQTRDRLRNNECYLEESSANLNLDYVAVWIDNLFTVNWMYDEKTPEVSYFKHFKPDEYEQLQEYIDE